MLVAQIVRCIGVYKSAVIIFFFEYRAICH